MNSNPSGSQHDHNRHRESSVGATRRFYLLSWLLAGSHYLATTESLHLATTWQPLDSNCPLASAGTEYSAFTVLRCCDLNRLDPTNTLDNAMAIPCDKACLMSRMKSLNAHIQ